MVGELDVVLDDPQGAHTFLDNSLFAEPFLRSLLLGMAAASVAEIMHTLMEYMETLEVGQIQNMFQLVEAGFRPALWIDHQIAVIAWIVLYVTEVVAMVSVLNNYGGDAASAAKELATLPSLTKRLLPFRLSDMVRTICKMSLPSLPAPTAAVRELPAAVPSLATASPEVNTPAAVVNKWAGSTSTRAIGSLKRSTKPKDRASKDRDTLENIFTKGPGMLPAPTGFDSLTAKRQKELLDRKAFLKNFWYAAAVASDVKPGKPKAVEVLGMKLVMFRDAKDGNKIKAINDICPHRAAPLSGGWLEEKNGHTCVVCPYHGWAFDGKGKLHDVPAAEEGESWPKRPLVSAFDIVERGGFVWLFYGSSSLPMEERPPIPMMPELEDPEWHPIYGEFEFDAPHWTVFQNAIDMAHIHFLHGDSFGNQDKPDIRAMKEIAHDAWGVVSEFKLTNKPVNPLWEFTSVPEVEVTAKAMLPSTSVISFTLGAGVSFITFVNTVPIDENRSVNRYSLIRNRFALDFLDPVAEDAMRKIFSEDQAMVELLRPDLLEREISVNADTVQTLFGKLRQEYIDLGYGTLPSRGGSCSPNGC